MNQATPQMRFTDCCGADRAGIYCPGRSEVVQQIGSSERSRSVPGSSSNSRANQKIDARSTHMLSELKAEFFKMREGDAMLRRQWDSWIRLTDRWIEWQEQATEEKLAFPELAVDILALPAIPSKPKLMPDPASFNVINGNLSETEAARSSIDHLKPGSMDGLAGTAVAGFGGLDVKTRSGKSDVLSSSVPEAKDCLRKQSFSIDGCPKQPVLSWDKETQTTPRTTQNTPRSAAANHLSSSSLFDIDEAASSSANHGTKKTKKFEGSFNNYFSTSKNYKHGAGSEGVQKKTCKNMLGELDVKIISAYHLRNVDSGFFGDVSDPYAVAHLGDTEFRTETVWNNLNPTWNNESSHFKFPADTSQKTQRTLYLEVCDNGGTSLGTTYLHLLKLEPSKSYSKRLKLCDPAGGKPEILVEVKFNSLQPATDDAHDFSHATSSNDHLGSTADLMNHQMSLFSAAGGEVECTLEPGKELEMKSDYAHAHNNREGTACSTNWSEEQSAMVGMASDGGIQHSNSSRHRKKERMWRSSIMGSSDILAKRRDVSVVGALRSALTMDASITAAFRFSDRKRLAQKLVESVTFESASCLLILIGAILNGVEVELLTTGKEPAFPFLEMQCTLSLMFCVEVAIRFAGLGPCEAIKDAFNLFDVFLVIFGLIEFFFAVCSPNQGEAGGARKSFQRGARTLRLARNLRILRMMRFFKELREMLIAVCGSLKTLMWLGVLLLLLLYFFAICFTSAVTEYLVMEVDDSELINQAVLAKEYGSLMNSMLSLFKAITNGVSWGLVMEPLGAIHWGLSFLYVAYIMFSVFAFMNAVTSVFVDNALRATQRESENIIQQSLEAKRETTKQLELLFKEADVEDQGLLSLEDLECFLDDDRAKAYFSSLGLATSDATQLFNLFDTDEGGKIDIEDFVEGCMKFKGEAKAIDLAELKKQVEKVLRRLMRLSLFTEDNFMKLDNRSKQESTEVQRLRSQVLQLQSQVAGRQAPSRQMAQSRATVVSPVSSGRAMSSGMMSP